MLQIYNTEIFNLRISIFGFKIFKYTNLQILQLPMGDLTQFTDIVLSCTIKEIGYLLMGHKQLL